MTDPVAQKPSSRLLLLVVEGLTHQLARESSRSTELDPFRSFLSGSTTRRVDLFPTGGRNGIAFSMATGSDPLQHGVVRNIEPDSLSHGIRPIDARSCRYLPFWTLLSRLGRSSAVLNWPSLMPAGLWTESAGSDVDHDLHRLVSSEAITSGRSGADHWVLPHDSVHPEAFAATVRSARVHPDSEEHLDPVRARNRSVDAIARTLDDEERPDVLACWLLALLPTSRDSQPDTPAHLGDLVMPLIERAGDAVIAVLDVPLLEDRHVQHRRRLPGRLHLANMPKNAPGLPLVLRDEDVVFTLLSTLGHSIERTPRPDIDVDAFERRMNKRARLYLEDGWRPYRTPGQQRIYNRSVAKKVGLLGVDQYNRGDLKQARPLLEQSLQSDFNPVTLLCLARTHLATGDRERMGRLSAICAKLDIGTAFRAAELFIAGARADALSMIDTHEPRTPAEVEFKIELLARAGDCERVCGCLRDLGARATLSLEPRICRIALVCARRTGDPELCAGLAKVILAAQPNRSRLSRFLEG